MEKAQEMLNDELAHLEEVNRTQVMAYLIYYIIKNILLKNKNILKVEKIQEARSTKLIDERNHSSLSQYDNVGELKVLVDQNEIPTPNLLSPYPNSVENNIDEETEEPIQRGYARYAFTAR